MCHTFSAPCLCFSLWFYPSPPSLPTETPRSVKVQLKYHQFQKPFLQKYSSELHHPLYCPACSLALSSPTSESSFILNSPLSLRSKKKSKCEHLMKTCYTEEESSEDSPITCDWVTKYRQITSAMQFSGLPKTFLCFRTYSIQSFKKAIAWNFQVESHFYNNKYNPISKRVEPKFKAINSFPYSILLQRF